MSRRVYYLRPGLYPEIPDSDDFEASSSNAPSSSPEFPLPELILPAGQFNFLELPEDDNQDSEYMPPRSRTTNNEKVAELLRFMKSKYPRFSLRMLLDTIFAKGASKTIREYVGNFTKDGGLVKFMDKLYGLRGSETSDLVVNMAGDVCAREASRLTERASRSRQTEDANFFRVVSKRLTVDMVKSFSIPDLTQRYARLTPHLQCILKAVISKEGKPELEGSRNPDDVS